MSRGQNGKRRQSTSLKKKIEPDFQNITCVPLQVLDLLGLPISHVVASGGRPVGPHYLRLGACSATASTKGSSGIRCDVDGEEEREEEEEEGEGGGREEGSREEEDEDEEEEDGDNDDVDEDDDEGDNQVVSWSLTPLSMASSSSSEEEQ
ncbi:hypothetical protein Cni_G10238 [Canna indica]|uniref:Uncharacterized protein n=1 Tax=Canna indica TaxID=4628 RepID=A0AAQ3Q754_9LILI|nr:hypothetical protein Cni_G10238 [Canna indica]